MRCIKIPKGTVQPGEDTQSAVIREVEEETGLRHFRVDRLLAEDLWENDDGVIHNRYFYKIRRMCVYVINVVSIGIVIIVLYFIIDILKNRQKNLFKRLIFLSFLFYMVNVLQQVTGGINFPPLAESNYWSWDWNIQLVPFYFLGDFINHYNNSGFSWFFWNAVKLSFFNFLLLLPLGVYLSIFKINSVKSAITIIFAVSFGIEILQVLLGYFGFIYPRSFNVDDLILNTLGGALGYLVFEQIKNYTVASNTINKE